MRPYCIWVEANPITDILIRRRKHTQRYRREDHVKTEVEIGVMLLKPKKYLGPPGGKRGKEGLFLETSEGMWSC